MNSLSSPLQVTMSPDGFWPCSMRWQGRQLRVLRVEGVYTQGRERCYRLRTPAGTYEIRFERDTGRWRMQRMPSPLQRWWARIRAMPRFLAPATRRRRAGRLASQPVAQRRHGPLAPVPAAEGC